MRITSYHCTITCGKKDISSVLKMIVFTKVEKKKRKRFSLDDVAPIKLIFQIFKEYLSEFTSTRTPNKIFGAQTANFMNFSKGLYNLWIMIG